MSRNINILSRRGSLENPTEEKPSHNVPAHCALGVSVTVPTSAVSLRPGVSVTVPTSAACPSVQRPSEDTDTEP